MAKPTVILVGADKGGVGKTTVARTLLDYFGAHQTPTRAFDTESPRGTLKRFHPEQTEVVDVTAVADQMKIFDTLGSSDARVTVIDVRAGLLSPTLQALSDIGFLESAKKGRNPHILNISPPLSMKERWFAPHVAYTMAKYGMSLCVLGMAGEFRDRGVHVNALWPRTVIATAALNLLGGDAIARRGRKPEVVADAAVAILRRDGRTCTGHFFVDEDVLRSEGVTDLGKYSVTAGAEDLLQDLFL